MWNKNIQIENRLKYWLLDVKSLSYRISNIAKLEIIPVKERKNRVFSNEKKVFGYKKSEDLYLREVLIYADKVPIMYARTILPIIHLRGFWRNIKKLKNKPLADIVFKKKILRSNFKFRKPSYNDEFSKRIRRFSLKKTKILAIRESTFRNKNEKVLLTEVFFNNFDQFQYSND
tara:strand:+ start:244 stop:765 length:522 start_codon:yes stop_codon:yes gene_type:complete